jgi:hypothetical protein
MAIRNSSSARVETRTSAKRAVDREVTMRTPTQIFDKWCAAHKLPRRFHPIPAELRPIFDEQRVAFDAAVSGIRRLFLPSRDIEIYADFNIDGTCNAAAAIYESMGIIAISKGAIMLPMEMFFRMLSHPSVFQGVGDSCGEQVGMQHREGILTDYNKLARARKKLEPNAPIDPIRCALAMVAIQCAWDFVFFHELVHITHGHLGYLKRSRSIPFILENSSSGRFHQLPSDDLDCQAIELWADSKAVTLTLGGFLRSKLGNGLDQFFPEPRHRLFLWSFAVFTLFRLRGIKIDIANMTGTHPPKAMRFEIAMLSASLDVSDLCPDLETDFWKIIQGGQAEADKGIIACGGNGLLPSDVAGVRHPAAVQRRGELLNHFDNVLKPELTKYSFVTLDKPKPIAVVAK